MDTINPNQADIILDAFSNPLGASINPCNIPLIFDPQLLFQNNGDSSFYPPAQISMEDAVTQTVDAVRLIIASVLQLRGIVTSQECELEQLRTEVGRLRGLPLPLVRSPFTGFESIGVCGGGPSVSGYNSLQNSGGPSVSGYNSLQNSGDPSMSGYSSLQNSGGPSMSGYNSLQNIPAQDYLAPHPTAAQAHPNIPPAPTITPNPNSDIFNTAYSFLATPTTTTTSTQITPAPAITPNPNNDNIFNTAYSFFATPTPTTTSTQIIPAAATTTTSTQITPAAATTTPTTTTTSTRITTTPIVLFPNADTFLPSFIPGPAKINTSRSSAPNKPIKTPEPDTPVTPPGSTSPTPSRPSKPPTRRYVWDSTNSPYRQR